MWSGALDTPWDPNDLSDAAPLPDDPLYAGKVVAARDGNAVLLGFTVREAGANSSVASAIRYRWSGMETTSA
jgi:hypothetical protein